MMKKCEKIPWYMKEGSGTIVERTFQIMILIVIVGYSFVIGYKFETFGEYAFIPVIVIIWGVSILIAMLFADEGDYK